MPKRMICLTLALILFTAVFSAAVGAAGGPNPVFPVGGVVPTASPTPPVNRFIPGSARVPASVGYDIYASLAKKYGIRNYINTKWQVLGYVAPDASPLNAYIVTHPTFDVRIETWGARSGLSNSLNSEVIGNLKTWAHNIEDASEGAIRFVDDPDKADILVVAEQNLLPSGTYKSGNRTAEGYATSVTLYAMKLSEPYSKASATKSKSPGRQAVINAGSKHFWTSPPTFRGSAELKRLVETIMGWYGCQASEYPEKADAALARQALIDRGYLAGSAAAGFDDEMKAAVMRLQADYGLEQTGNIDRVTLIALYYDKAAVEEILNKYPEAE